MKAAWFCILLLGLFCPAPAQTLDPLEQLADILENVEAENSAILENLLKYREHPLPLNRATREELEELIFLSPGQIDSLLTYRRHHPPLRSEKELLNIPGFNRETVEAIRPFISFEGKHVPLAFNLRQQWRYSWPEKAGFSEGDYGNPLFLQNRLSLTLREHLQFGLLVEKDPGENNWSDFYSFYAAYRSGNSRVYIGDFKLLVGMGLMLWTDYGQPLSPGNIQQGLGFSGILREYRSSNEDNPLRGVGFSIRIANHWEAAGWTGQRGLDASPQPDGSVRTVSSTGYHRTESELARKNCLKETLSGTAITFTRRDFYIQGVINQSRYEPVVSGFPANSRHWGMNYGLRTGKIRFAGEVALNERGTPAIQNTLSIILPNFRYQLAGYYYHPDYRLLQGAALGEFSAPPQNRIGAAGLLDFRPVKAVNLQGFIHYYSEIKPAEGKTAAHADYYLQLSARLNKTRVSLRMKRKNRPIEYSQWQAFTRYAHSLQFNLLHPLHPRLFWKQRFETSWAGPLLPARRYYGISYFSEIIWKISRRFKVLYRYSGFDIPDYQLRIYEFEPDLPGVLRISAWNDNGERHLLLTTCKVSNRLELHLKYAYRHYFDRETLGSGPDEIKSNHLNEVRCSLLVHW